MGLLWKCGGGGVRWLQGHVVLWGMARGVAVPWGVTVGMQGAGMALGVPGMQLCGDAQEGCRAVW